MIFLNSIKNEILTSKWLFFGITIYIYGWNLKKEVVFLSNAYELGINKWDLILRILCDPYLIIYFLWPLWIFISIKIILRGFDYIILIRLQSFKNWIIYTLKEVSMFLLIFLTVLVGIIFLLAINLPHSLEWSSLSKTIIGHNEILINLSSINDSPLSIFFLQISLFSLAAITFHIITASIFTVINKKSIVILIGVISFLGAIFSFKSFFSLLEIVSISNYLFLHQANASFNRLFIPFLILIAISTSLIAIVSLKDRFNSVNFKNILIKNSKFIIYISLCCLGIVNTLISNQIELKTFGDILFVTFFGVSEDGFDLKIYIYHAIVFLGFSYLLQLYLSEALTNRFYYTAIRYQSINIWFFQLFKTIVKLIFLLLVSLFLITGFSAYFLGYSLTLDVTVLGGSSNFEVAYQFMINGFLQTLNYSLIVLIISWTFKDVFYSMIAVGFVLIIGMPFINTYGIFPSALNSLGYATGNFSNLLNFSIVLIVSLIIEFIILLNLLNKKDIQF